MTDFIREVNEELRQDRFRTFLTRFWPLILAGVVFVLAAVGAWSLSDYLATQKAQAVGGRYKDALDLSRDGKTADAIAALNGVVAEGTPGYRLLARFRAAADTGKTDPAAGAKLLDALASDNAIDPALQNLARLRAATLLVDSASYPDLKQRLGPLADANSGLRGSARELLAVAALKAGQNEEAGRWLDAIETDPTTPAPLRQRAEAMLGLVRAGGGDDMSASSPQPAAPGSAGAPPSAALESVPPPVGQPPK